jgi:ApaG protein
MIKDPIMLTYTKTTKDITISVQSSFLEARSNIIQKNFFFVYFISIENNSSEAVQLLRRRWYIHDSVAEDYEVEGDGVVGEQPVIAPGATYTYNSFSILKSYEGWMEGSYFMRKDDGQEFEVEIPRFYLQARLN